AHQHGGGGRILLVGEDLAGRQRQVHHGGLHRVHGGDRLAEFALHRPLESRLLTEGGGGEVVVVEEAVATAVAVGRQSLAAECDPGGIDVVLGDQDGVAAVGEFIGDAAGVELLDHRRGVL